MVVVYSLTKPTIGVSIMTIVNLTTERIIVVMGGISHDSKVPSGTIDNVFGRMLNNGMVFKKVKPADIDVVVQDLVTEGDNAFIEV